MVLPESIILPSGAPLPAATDLLESVTTTPDAGSTCLYADPCSMAPFGLSDQAYSLPCSKLFSWMDTISKPVVLRWVREQPKRGGCGMVQRASQILKFTCNARERKRPDDEICQRALDYEWACVGLGFSDPTTASYLSGSCQSKVRSKASNAATEINRNLSCLSLMNSAAGPRALK